MNERHHQVLGFDVYGTLIDTSGIASALKQVIDLKQEAIDSFVDTWRNKQLEYSFRRGLMNRYVDFSICTAQALDYCCQYFLVEMTLEQRNFLMNQYQSLPTFDDVEEGLKKIHQSGVSIYAFSNGPSRNVVNLLKHSKIYSFFDGVVSTHEVSSFKPNPTVYAHFLSRTQAEPSKAWLISSNPFDVLGAVSFGIKGIWLNRSQHLAKRNILDPWEITPTATINSLTQLKELLKLE